MREDVIRSAVAIGPSKGMAVVGLTLTVLAASLVILLSLWAGPLVPRADVFVSAHMILHLGIVSIAAPLIALAIALMPGVITAGLFGARSAIAASLFDMLVVWLWHAAVLH